MMIAMICQVCVDVYCIYGIISRKTPLPEFISLAQRYTFLSFWPLPVNLLSLHLLSYST